MRDAEALHTAARAYCRHRAAEWHEAYFERRAADRDDAEDAWSSRRFLHDLLVEVERATPDDFESLEDARAGLLEAAGRGQLDPSRRSDRRERRARDVERRRFREYVAAVSEADLGLVEPLPYRRTLGSEERDGLLAEVARLWGAWLPVDPGWTVRDLPPDTAAFDASALDDASMVEPLRRALLDRGVARIYELVECDDGTPSSELEVADADVWCSVHIRYWIDSSFAWVVYADGGDTVTITGADLVAAVEEGPPSWNAFRHVWRYEPS